MRTDIQGSTIKLLDAVTMNSVHVADYQRFCDSIHVGITTIDVSGVTEADSVCVALLAAAKRLARQQQLEIHIIGVPARLITLMALYGVEESLQ
ncbi:MAG: STAS domain-containing protein [Snodgrassella sp.]|nr:STAS domain-containing protein [Snodgrassella sp.]